MALTGPVSKSDGIVENSVNLIQSSRVLKVSCEVNNENFLTQNLQRFWNLDSFGIKENEKALYENVADEIKLEGDRYTVKLLFKEDHQSFLKIIRRVQKD